MIILPCLEFFYHNGYVFYIFVLTWVFGMLWRLMHL